MRRCYTFLILMIFFQSMEGQSGNQYVYDFLSLPTSPRESALGGSLITISDEDLSLAVANPALLNDKMHNRLFFGHNFLFAGISNGYAGYARQIPTLNIVAHGGIKYISYGQFDLTDEYGVMNSTFDANELAIHLGAAKKLNERLSIGSNLKFISSQLGGYNSSGMAIDIGMHYVNPESNFTAALVLKNGGGELSTYTAERELSPIDIQIGISKKPQHLPFRISVIMHNLQRWNLKYDSPLEEETDLFGNPIETSKLSREIDNFFRHIIFNGELLIGTHQNLRLRLGYNHLRRKELSVSNFRSLGGFSFGFGIKVSKFRLDYGVGYYHLAGGNNHISISTDLDDFFGKKL